jgi:hypothetical protein
MTRTFRYVPWRLVESYLQLGWMAVNCRPHVHMDQYRAILCWPCGCPCVEPDYPERI